MTRAAILPGALALALALSTAAPAQESDPAAELAGRVPGAAATCIEQDRVGPPLVFRPDAVLFRQSGARIWRMQPIEACPQLRWGVHLIVDNTGHRLCRGDRFAVLPPGSGIPSAHCRMGSFVPYDKVKA